MRNDWALLEASRAPAEPSVSAMAAWLAGQMKTVKIVPKAVSVYGRWTEVQERRLAGLLGEALRTVFFCTDTEAHRWDAGTPAGAALLPAANALPIVRAVTAPFLTSLRGMAVVYVMDEAEEAGCAALAADQAGLRGAALCPFPGGGVLLTSFGGGTDSAVIEPMDAALSDEQKDLFLAALILYGAERAKTLLAAADTVRRAARFML